MSVVRRYFLVLYLLTLTTRSDGQNLCPEATECYCFFSGYDIRADCIGPEIKFVSEDLPWNMTQLHISQSGMETLLSGNLSIYKDLNQVELIDNPSLSTIESEAFKGLSLMDQLIVLHNIIGSIPPDTLPETLEILNLGSNRLDSVPPLDGLVDLEIVNLDNNNIDSIKGNAFSSNRRLYNLYISYNDIQSIATDAFENLNNLINLYLDSNEITSLESGDFNGLSKLQILSLVDNRLTELTNDAFSGIGTSTLTQLYLSSNQIASIESNAFSDFSNLTLINLVNNRLTSVPSSAIKGPMMLHFLDLSLNLFATIEDDAFAGMSNLNTLNIGEMDTLLTLSQNAFVGMPKLEMFTLHGNKNLTSLTLEHLPDSELLRLRELNIYDNGFTTLHEETFATKADLQRVQLFANPLHCDCKLRWMPRVIEEDVVWARDWVSGNQILCRTPPHLETFNIPTMKVKDFTCDLPVVSPSYEGDQGKIVAYLHGNATLMAVATSGIPRTWWVTPSGEQYVPLRTVPTHIQLIEDIAPSETYEKTADETVVIAILEFRNTTLEDAGVYSVWASNHLGNVSAEVILEVLPYELTPAPLLTTLVVGRADTVASPRLVLLLLIMVITVYIM